MSKGGANGPSTVTIAVVSEVINLEPVEGIRKFGQQLAKAFQDYCLARVIRIGYDKKKLEKDRMSFFSKCIWLFHCRAHLKKIRPDVLIFIPSSPRFTLNLLKFLFWRKIPRKRAIILLQPPNGPSAGISRILGMLGILENTKIFHQFDRKLLPSITRVSSPTLLPSGIDTNQFSPVSQEDKMLLRRRFGIEMDERIILSVGHLKKGRNIDLLSNVARRINAKIIFIASSLTDRNHELRKQLCESGVIVIDRKFENIQDIYAIADCYLFPTVRTDSAIGVPLSILEALSMNLPVVTSSFGILPELFGNREGIFFFRDEEEAISQIEKGLSMDDIDNRQIALEYDWKAIASMIFSDLGI